MTNDGVTNSNQPTDTQIRKADSLYHHYVAEAGLYGQAFFGHKTTRVQKRLLDHLWKRAMKEAGYSE